MDLIKEKWLSLYRLDKPIRRKMGIPNQTRDPIGFNMFIDLEITHLLMERAETIVFPSEVFLDLIHNIDRIDTSGPLYIPYPFTLIQLTKPLPESSVMPFVERTIMEQVRNLKEDKFEGLLLSIQEVDSDMFKIYDKMKCDSIGLFLSQAASRCAWKPTGIRSVPWWDNLSSKPSREQTENKTRLIQLAYAVSMFLNAPNVIMEKKEPDPKLVRKKMKSKKPAPLSYHTIYIEKIESKYETRRKTGITHGHMYPVRGHFRKLKHLDKPVWVKNHFRGLAYGDDSLIKGVYKVKNPKK